MDCADPALHDLREIDMSMSISGMGGAWSPQAMSGASMRMSPTQKMTNVYQQIDTTKSGSITGQQFSQAFNGLNPPAAFKAMGASAIFSQLDPNGSVSQEDFVSGMTNLMSKARHHHHTGSGATASTTSGTTPASPAQTLASSVQALGSLSGQAATASATGTGSLINAVL